MISFNPSTTWAISSGEARPRRRPILSIDSVRIGLIFAHDFLGNPLDSNSSVSGKPARCDLLVMATAITVPERWLKTSWLRIRTGRRPACSCPRTGFKSAHRMSPLSILAIPIVPQKDLPLPKLSRKPDPTWRILSQACFAQFALASRQPQSESLCFDSGRQPS